MQIKISEIKNNPANPRTIRDKQFSDLKRSIAQFPAMLAKRPIAVTKDGKNWMAIGGNQRTRALLDLQKDIEDYEGFLQRYECTPDAAAILTKYFADGVHVVDCTDLSADEQRRFIIADNLPFGEWDTDALANEWDVDELKEWGMPEFIFGGVELNSEIPDELTSENKSSQIKVIITVPDIDTLNSFELKVKELVSSFSGVSYSVSGFEL